MATDLFQARGIKVDQPKDLFAERGIEPSKNNPSLINTIKDKAIEAAKNLNARGNADHKVVAYKCNTCFKYHVGRNKSPLVRNRKFMTIDDMNRINKFKSKEIESRGLRKWS